MTAIANDTTSSAFHASLMDAIEAGLTSEGDDLMALLADDVRQMGYAVPEALLPYDESEVLSHDDSTYGDPDCYECHQDVDWREEGRSARDYQGTRWAAKPTAMLTY